MSARIEATSKDQTGRIVIIAALAGLTGVAITVVAAAMLLLGATGGTGQHVVEAVPAPALAPGEPDYFQRQRGSLVAPGLGEPDYFQRQRGSLVAPGLGEPDYFQRQRGSTVAPAAGDPDYFQRNVVMPGAPALQVGEPDYFQRHRAP